MYSFSDDFNYLDCNFLIIKVAAYNLEIKLIRFKLSRQ